MLSYGRGIFLGSVFFAFAGLSAGTEPYLPAPPPPPPPPPVVNLPNQTMPAYPAIPIPAYPYPPMSSDRKLVAPKFTPSVQLSPTYPTATERMPGSVKRNDRKPAAPQAKKPAANPAFKTAFRNYEKNFDKHQRSLDDLLARHGGDWNALNNNPEDRKACETVLKQWGEDEARLEALYRGSPGPMVLSPGKAEPTGVVHEAVDGDELTTGDVDR